MPGLSERQVVDNLNQMLLAVVEDEEKWLRMLQQYCERYSKANDMELQITHFPNAYSFLETYDGRFSAVLMDIGLPGLDGMACARRLRQKDDQVPLLFITNMAQYAIRGYEVNALDFIVKPVVYEEFALKMDKLCRYLARIAPATCVLHLKGETRVLAVGDITYIEVFNHSLLFHTRTETLQTWGKLSSYEEDPLFSDFIRCSQSFLVNCRFVSSVSAEQLTVAGVQLPVARRKRKECMDKMAYVFGRRSI